MIRVCKREILKQCQLSYRPSRGDIVQLIYRLRRSHCYTFRGKKSMYPSTVLTHPRDSEPVELDDVLHEESTQLPDGVDDGFRLLAALLAEPVHRQAASVLIGNRLPGGGQRLLPGRYILRVTLEALYVANVCFGVKHALGPWWHGDKQRFGWGSWNDCC